MSCGDQRVAAQLSNSEARIGFVAALVATFLPLRLRGSDIRELLLNPDCIATGVKQRSSSLITRRKKHIHTDLRDTYRWFLDHIAKGQAA